jgi:hypothetical protein
VLILLMLLGAFQPAPGGPATVFPWGPRIEKGPFSAYSAFSALFLGKPSHLMLLRSVSPEAMAKPVLHPERGEMTFRELIETMAGHDLNHLAQLEAIAVQVPISR